MAGTATAHEDYKPLRQLVKFAQGEVVKAVTVEIVDDQQWEPDESFFLRMSVPLTQRSVRLGRKTVMEIVIINDDGELLSLEDQRYHLFYVTRTGVFVIFLNINFQSRGSSSSCDEEF